MKISQYNIKIFKDELVALQKVSEEVDKAADDWLKLQKQREDWGSVDQYSVQRRRNTLERKLMKFRKQLATVYDYMGDRGLVEFVPERDIEDEVEVHG